MPSIPINSKIQLELQSIIDGIANLETSELESFAAKVNNMVAHRKAPALTERESQLLLTINQSLSPDLQKRYNLLIKKSEQEILSKEEEKEYAVLASKLEEMDVLRLQSLVELAQLRSITVDELLEQLDINLAVNG